MILLDSHMESVVSEINPLVQKRPKCPNTKFQTITSQEKKTRRKSISGTARNPLQKYLDKSDCFDIIVVERGSHLRELPHVHISLSDLRWVGNPAKSVTFFLLLGCRIYKVPENTRNQFYRRALGLFSMEKKIWTKNINLSWRNLKMKIVGPKIFFELRNF